MTSWFITKNSRLLTRTIVGAVTASVCGGYIAFNGPLLNTYQSLMQMYSDGTPKRLPSKVLQIADLVVNDCKEKGNIYVSEEKSNIRFFAAIGQDLFHAGSTRLPWGCIVGVPFTFGIKNRNDMDLLNLKIHRREDIDWSSEGDELLQSLILSENAQKFAMAREVLMCSGESVLTEALFLACAILVPARIVHLANRKRETFKYTFKKHAVFYVALYCVSFILFKCIRDFEKHSSEIECDKRAAILGSEYLEGGIEFYEKTLSKNKALRKLMGSDGERLYDSDGNERYWLLPQMPVSKRLELLQRLKKEQDEAVS